MRARRSLLGVAAVGMVAAVALALGAGRAPAAPISGVVHTTSGAGLFNAQVQAWVGNSLVTNTSTAADGSYTLTLADGSYTLKVSAPNGAPYGSLERRVQVAGSALTGQDFTLPDANVVGHVRRPDGTDLPANAFGRVDVRDGAGHYIPNGPAGANADNSGAYALVLPAGSYTLHASASGPGGAGLTPADVAVTIPASGSQTININLTQPNVSGHVYRPDGTTPVETFISVLTASGNWAGIDGDSSAADGSYSLRLPEGTWLLRTSPEGTYAAGSSTVTVTAGSNLTQDILLQNPDLIVHVSNPNRGGDVENSWVSVSQGTGSVAGASTAADGTVRFALPSGTYTTSAQAPDASPYDNSRSVSTTVSTGSVQTVELALRAPNVSGRVVDSAGHGVEGAGVQINSGGEHGPWVTQVQTDANGDFAVALEDGSYTAIVSPPDGSAFGQADAVTFGVSGTTVVAAITLPAANVAGKVFRPDGTTPVGSASVSVHTSDWSVQQDANTGADGSFHFRLRPGDYLITVNPPYGSTGFGSAQGAFTLADVPITGLNFNLTVPNVSGIVTTPSTDALGHAVTPTPVAGATVSVHNDDYTLQTNAFTDSSGTFQVFLPSTGGPFTFQAYAPGGADYDNSPGVTVAGPTSSTVTLRYVARNVTGFAYFGAVSSPPDATSAAPTAATGVDVAIHSVDYSVYSSSQTDDQGKFRAGLGPGTYVAQARGGDSAFTDSPPFTFTVAADGTVTPSPINLVLGKPQLKGTVVDAAGHGVGYAFVSVHSSNYSVYAYGQTQSDGTFVIGGLPAGGGYTADVEPPWGDSSVLRTEVAGITVPADETLWPVAVSNNTDGKFHYAIAVDSIRVTIRRADGTPITAGASVNAYQDSGGYAYKTASSGGTYDLKVGEGQWNVSVYPSSPTANWVYAGQPKIVSVDAAHDDGSHVFAVTLTVANATAQVTGRIVDPAGNPVHQYQAWVYVSTPSGIGNGASVASNGTFSINVPAGSFSVFAYPQNQNWGSPAPLPVTVNDGQTLNVGDVSLLLRDAEIRGKVAFAGGSAIKGAEVFAYQPDGGGYADATTAADGSYSLKVTAGHWAIAIWPAPGDSWVYLGSPLDVTIASGGLSTRQDFTAAPVAGYIKGVVLEPSGATASVNAWVSAESAAGEAGAPVNGGSFSVPAVAGTYSVRLHLSPGTPFLSTSTASVTVASDGTVTPANLTFTLSALDKTISGRLLDQSGGLLSSSSVTVSAIDGNGNYESAQVESNGTYSLAVGAGTWQLGVDILQPGLTAVAFGDGHGNIASSTVPITGANATRDVIVAVADQHLAGSVQTSTGAAVPYAWISVDSPPSATTPVHTGALADELGHFDIRVPSGTYLVSASAKIANQDSPQIVTVTTAGGSQSVSPLTLAFRARDVTITGHVNAPVAGLVIGVHAWSDKGGFAETNADSSGDYSLSVAGNDMWHVDAGAASGTSAYVTSGGTAVTVGASGSFPAAALTLTAVAVPPVLSETFDATQPKVIHFGDVQLDIPAGALANSGTVRISASTIADPADTAAAHPVGLGYTFQAFDATGTEIKTRFTNQLRITFPYDPARLATLGLTASDLAPAYFDPITNSYRPASNVVIDPVAHTISFGTDHFTSFVLQSATLAAPTVTAVTPSSGAAGTARLVTVTGTAFVSGASVLIGSYLATGVTVVDSTTITGTIPATVPSGTYAVTVTNSGGRSGSKSAALTLTGASTPAVTEKADLGVKMATFPNSVHVGDTLTYIVSVSGKNGALATGIKLHVDLPSGVTLLSTYADHGPGTCTGTTSLTCFLDYIGGTGVATVRIAVRVDKAGAVRSVATLAFDQLDLSRKDNTASITTTVTDSLVAPSVSVGGKVPVASVQVVRRGGTAIVASSVTTDQASTIVVRVLAGKPRHALQLLKSSRVGTATTGRPHAEITYRISAGHAVPIRLLVDAEGLSGKGYLQVIVNGAGGATSRLVPLR